MRTKNRNDLVEIFEIPLKSCFESTGSNKLTYAGRFTHVVVPLIMLMTITLQSCNDDTSKSDSLKTELRIGQAEVEYTPEVGHGLVGNYRGDDYASRGVHDPLYGKALVAEGTNGVKAAVLTVDICYIPADMIDLMRKHIAARRPISPPNIS